MARCIVIRTVEGVLGRRKFIACSNQRLLLTVKMYGCNRRRSRYLRLLLLVLAKRCFRVSFHVRLEYFAKVTGAGAVGVGHGQRRNPTRIDLAVGKNSLPGCAIIPIVSGFL